MHVLVTRPEPGSARTAALLRAHGHQPLVLPLTRTVPLAGGNKLLQRIPACAYVVTSAAAFRHWKMSNPVPGQLATPLYAVGEATGQSARGAGFSDVRTGPGDGDALAGMIVSDCKTGRLTVSESAPLIYVAGRVRRSRIEALIGAENLPLRVVEIYDTQNISYSTDFICERIPAKSPIAVFLYSHHGAALLFQHLLRENSDKILKYCFFLCLSSHVASAVPAPFKTQTRIAAAPNEAELLILLDHLSSAS